MARPTPRRREGLPEWMSGVDAAWLHMDRPIDLMVMNRAFGWTTRWTGTREGHGGAPCRALPRFSQRSSIRTYTSSFSGYVMKLARP